MFIQIFSTIHLESDSTLLTPRLTPDSTSLEPIYNDLIGTKDSEIKIAKIEKATINLYSTQFKREKKLHYRNQSQHVERCSSALLDDDNNDEDDSHSAHNQEFDNEGR